MGISDKFPGDTDATGLGPALRDPLPCSHGTRLELVILLNQLLPAGIFKLIIHYPLKQTWSSLLHRETTQGNYWHIILVLYFVYLCSLNRLQWKLQTLCLEWNETSSRLVTLALSFKWNFSQEFQGDVCFFCSLLVAIIFYAVPANRRVAQLAWDCIANSGRMESLKRSFLLSASLQCREHRVWTMHAGGTVRLWKGTGGRHKASRMNLPDCAGSSRWALPFLYHLATLWIPSFPFLRMKLLHVQRWLVS